MSNWKHAYGWSGHILVSKGNMDGDEDHNVIAIPSDVFRRIVKAFEDCELDERIHVEQLGVTSIGEVNFLAAGCCFSEGFQFYGTVFTHAEDWVEKLHSGSQLFIDHDPEYLKAMKEIYGLELPPCRLMIGCSSEH